jgi:hypothetical protein|tara:strand:- start:303 stop:587 length:285 start_codon:yes stop_codon:yes gene_type:complete
MKNKVCGMCAVVFLLIGNLTFSIYSHINISKESEPLEVKVLVSEDLIRIETKIDAIYNECRLRDSAIYGNLLELKEVVTGLKTISTRDYIAELQ